MTTLSKIIFAFVAFPLWGIEGAAQYVQLVVNPKMTAVVGQNTAYKQARLALYNTSMDSIKSAKQKMAEDWAAITAIQQKIYSSLTNVDDAIKQSKELSLILTQKIPAVFSNLAQAAQLSAQKTYLVAYYQNVYNLLVPKITDLTTYITQLVMSSGDDPSLMIDQIKRDQMLWSVFNRINTIYNISQAEVNLFKLYNLQTAVNSVVPLSFYKNVDQSIVTNTLNMIKLMP